MKVSFWTPLCCLLLGAQAPLPGLLSVPFKKRGMYYLKVRCFTASFSFQIGPRFLVLFSSSEQVRVGRPHFAISLRVQPAHSHDRHCRMRGNVLWVLALLSHGRTAEETHHKHGTRNTAKGGLGHYMVLARICSL